MKVFSIINADSKEESSLSKLTIAPVRIFVKEVKTLLENCKAARPKWDNWLNGSSSIKKLHEFCEKLQPTLNEKARLVAPEHDEEKPLTDLQLFELAKRLLDIRLGENNEKLTNHLLPLEKIFTFERLSALHRVLYYWNSKPDRSLSFHDFKLLFEFPIDKVDSAAIFLVLRADENKLFPQKATEAAKVYLFSFEFHPFADDKVLNWRRNNMKAFIEFAMAAPLEMTDKLSVALKYLINNNVCTEENRNALLAQPAYSIDLALAIIWLYERKIYTPDNIKKLADNYENAPYLKKVGKIESLEEGDKELNQQIFDATMARAQTVKTERKQNVSMLFVQPAKAQYDEKNDGKDAKVQAAVIDKTVSKKIEEAPNDDANKISSLISGFSPF